MSQFTTRPDIAGTFGVATSTHWIASAVGMRILEAGGNAFDAAAAMGFTLQVVEPHLNGPLGDMTLMVRPAGAEAPTVICGQGPAPAGATIAHYTSEGLTAVPGTGLLATVIPGAFGAWMRMLAEHGQMPLRSILEPAIHYARHGHPVLPRVAQTIAGLSEFFKGEWPSSFETWLPNGNAPSAQSLFCNPVLAESYDRLLSEAEAGGDSHAAQIEAARRAFYEGFIAETIDGFLQSAELMDSEGARRKGVLRGSDLAAWHAHLEAPLCTSYHGWSVWKAGMWSQGPTLLQSLNLLEGHDLAAMDPMGADFVHLVTEAMKLSFADREAYYGDPDANLLPTEELLSKTYANARRALIGAEASRAQRPGSIAGLEAWAQAAIERSTQIAPKQVGAGGGEPTMAHLTERRGDTVHLDVIDRWGNMVSATPSGGWLQSSPVVPGLGMPLNTRAQMFWLDEGLPTSLAPGRRPRTTLSPSMAATDGLDLAFGTPGGDQQDQWQLVMFLRFVHGAQHSLQAAIDAPLFHTSHFQSSFAPRVARPGTLMVEPNFGEDAIANLRARGHDVDVAEPWTVGRLTAASRHVDGLLHAAATPRLMQAYAVGR